MKRSLLRQCMRTARLAHVNKNHPCWDGTARHYSFIVHNHHILSMGMNRTFMPPPKHYGYPVYANIHAEIDTWRKARGLLCGEPFEIINIKLTKCKPYESRISKPCSPCGIFLQAQGCLRVYYSIERDIFEHIKL